MSFWITGGVLDSLLHVSALFRMSLSAVRTARGHGFSRNKHVGHPWGYQYPQLRTLRISTYGDRYLLADARGLFLRLSQSLSFSNGLVTLWRNLILLTRASIYNTTYLSKCSYHDRDHGLYGRMPYLGAGIRHKGRQSFRHPDKAFMEGRTGSCSRLASHQRYASTIDRF